MEQIPFFVLPFSPVNIIPIGKGEAVPLQAWSGPEGSRRVFNTRVFSHRQFWLSQPTNSHITSNTVIKAMLRIPENLVWHIFSYTITAACTNQGNTHESDTVSLHSQKEFAHQPIHLKTHTIKLLNQFTDQTFVFKKVQLRHGCHRTLGKHTALEKR